jgi:hypothetical protein
MNFKFPVYEKSFRSATDSKKHDGQLYGISFSPKDCEPVALEFYQMVECADHQSRCFGDLSKLIRGLFV